MSEKEKNCLFFGLGSSAVAYGGYCLLGAATGGLGWIIGGAVVCGGILGTRNCYQQYHDDSQKEFSYDSFSDDVKNGALLGTGIGIAAAFIRGVNDKGIKKDNNDTKNGKQEQRIEASYHDESRDSFSQKEMKFLLVNKID